MKSKIIEWIRQILLKTGLPMKRKFDEFLSQFHFSIAFRIAFYYVRLFVFYGILFFIIAYAVYIQVEHSTYDEYARERIDTFSSGEGEFENPYSEQGVSMRVYTISTGQELYNDLAESLSGASFLFGKYSFNYNNNQKLIVADTYSYVRDGEEYGVLFQYDLTRAMNQLHKFILLLIVLYIFLVLSVAKFGATGIERLLQPLKNMSVVANRLTVNNLHSERLNVEGTKNELKELATTFNRMLDRIELSYESQKQFASDASHELRTPIAVIQGYANMLERWGSKEEEILEESIEAISNEAKSMKELVEKLLFLSRNDNKPLQLSKKHFNMKVVVEELIKETKLMEHNRTITTRYLEDVIVCGDQQALKQAIRIFIENAIKYSSDGDFIVISCENKEGTCVVTVDDSGIGMKKEDMDKIFERFYRADDVRTGGLSGHGLGLSIAKLIVLKHTGSILVKSQYTKGSSFSIVLPDYYKKGCFR